MQSTDPARPHSPDWRRRLMVTLIVGTSMLYCLGTGAYALKRSLLPGGPATAPVAVGPTQTASATSQPPEPTPTMEPLVFPTLPFATTAAQPTEALAEPTPWETPAAWPTAVPTAPATATLSPTLEAPTPTLEPTATATPPPTETPTETPGHGNDRPTETPSPQPE